MRDLALLLCMALGAAAPAAAQGPFAAVARVGDDVVTGYELAQRMRFNQLLGTPGDLREASLGQLIDDRLRLSEAARLDIAITDEQVETGMSEFAGRANLETEAFVDILGQAGVDEATFQDFVRAGVAWREAVRAQGGPIAEVSDTEIDRAVARGDVEGAGGPRLLVSEIIIPAPTPEARAAAIARARQIAGVSDEEAFGRAARAYSAASSAAGGGRLNWLGADALPEPVRAAIAGLRPGQVTSPVEVPGAIAVFLVRGVGGVAEDRAAGTIDYAAFYIPGGRSPGALAEAARVRASIDTCDDLYGMAHGLPAERLERGALPPSRIPADIAAELALLDANEVSTRLTRADGSTLVFLMLCERLGAVDPLTVDRAGVANAIRNARLAAFAESYLDELRAETQVVRF